MAPMPLNCARADIRGKEREAVQTHVNSPLIMPLPARVPPNRSGEFERFGELICLANTPIREESGSDLLSFGVIRDTVSSPPWRRSFVKIMLEHSRSPLQAPSWVSWVRKQFWGRLHRVSTEGRRKRPPHMFRRQITLTCLIVRGQRRRIAVCPAVNPGMRWRTATLPAGSPAPVLPAQSRYPW
jgi:hypothetical protein